MHKAESPGMQGLPGAQFEAIVDELLVLGIDCSLADLGTAVALVAENRVPYATHMHPDLMGAAGLEAALYKSHKAHPLKHFPVSHSPLAPLRVGSCAKAQAVVPSSSFKSPQTIAL